MAQVIKNLPEIQETWVRSLGLEDPLEKGKATYSSILAWKIPWSEEPGRLQSMGLQRVGHDWAIKHSTEPWARWGFPGLVRSHGRGHGNPFQYSFLENPHGQRSLAGYSLWGHKGLEMTEWLITRTWARHPARDPQTARFPTHTEMVIQSGKATLNQWL